MSTFSLPSYHSRSLRLRPGMDGYCARCAHDGHDRDQCSNKDHANIVSGGPCPHPRIRGIASEAGTIRPSDSVSNIGEMSLRDLLQLTSTHRSPTTEVTVAQVRDQEGLAYLTDAEAARIAAQWNTARRLASRQAAEASLRAAGLDPSTVLDPISPPTAVPATLPQNVAQPPPLTNAVPPVAPGTTQTVAFAAAPAPGATRLVDQVEVGHMTLTLARTDFAVVHRATYDAAMIQTALTAAGQGTFRNLAYLSFRFLAPPVTNGWRLLIRLVQQPTLPAAPRDINSFTAIGGTLIERTNTDPSGLVGITSVPMPPNTDLSIPIHVVAVLQMATTTGTTGSFGRHTIEVGANVS